MYSALDFREPFLGILNLYASSWIADTIPMTRVFYVI